MSSEYMQVVPVSQKLIPPPYEDFLSTALIVTKLPRVCCTEDPNLSANTC